MESENIYEILNNFKSKTEAYKYFGLCDNNKGIVKLKDIAKSVEFNLDIYKERRKTSIKFCKKCNKILIKNQKYFCSHSCSATFGNTNRMLSDDTKNKIRNTLLSKSTKKEKLKKNCKICGQESCISKEICRHGKNWFNNLQPFGFDIHTIGTIYIIDEYNHIKELLLNDYLINNLSPKDIKNKYNYDKKSENILHVLKSFNIKTKNLSESVINACLQGKLNTKIENIKTKYQFKCGWHTTWDNKKIYYRSSYELTYAKILNDKMVEYDVEKFRIKYFDTQQAKYRIAIPDFYIPSENKIIEIKSRVSFNKQNIIDKFNEYIKLGFNVSLIFENVEYTFDELHNIKQNNYIL